MTDTSDKACALACMLVSNPQDALRRDGWQKEVNDLIRALRDERDRLKERSHWLIGAIIFVVVVAVTFSRPWR